VIDPDFLWHATIGGMLALGGLCLVHARDTETLVGGIAALALAAALVTWDAVRVDAPQHERGAPVGVRR